MNVRLLIACAAGIGGGFLLPLPASAPPARKSAMPPSVISRAVEPNAKSLGPEEIIALSVEECSATLDALLREFGVVTPSPEQQHVAVALLLRALHEHTDAAVFLKSRRLPAWLLAAAWLEKPDTVPGSLRLALSTMPAGQEAARRIAQELAATDERKAADFTATMPAVWRRSLREAALLGLATREPMRALRESGISEGLHETLVFAAARCAPVDRAVKAIAEYVDDDFYMTIKPMLALLHSRDADRTAELIAATENPKLQKWLTEVTAESTAPESLAKPAAAILAAPGGAARQEIERAITELGFQAVQDPAAAQAAWAALPDGGEKDRAAGAIASALAERDTAAAFAWADKNSPHSTYEVLRVAAASDAPAALTAVLRLSEGNPQREMTLKALLQPGRPRLNGFGNISDVPALLRELPPDLQKLIAPEPVIPFEGVKPATEKSEPFDVQLR